MKKTASTTERSPRPAADQPIAWTPDAVARSSGVSHVILTGGRPEIINGVRVVRFAERARDGRGICIRIDTRPDLAAAVAEWTATQARTVTIYLSSRGWGDYAPVVWTGDIARPDTDIIAECRELLAQATDVDDTLSDQALCAKVRAARKRWTAARTRTVSPDAPRHGKGYCYHCESYCYGDCGDYQPDPLRAAVSTWQHATREGALNEDL
jgi:hypothetical protein